MGLGSFITGIIGAGKKQQGLDRALEEINNAEKKSEGILRQQRTAQAGELSSVFQAQQGQTNQQFNQAKIDEAAFAQAQLDQLDQLLQKELPFDNAARDLIGTLKNNAQNLPGFKPVEFKDPGAPPQEFLNLRDFAVQDANRQVNAKLASAGLFGSGQGIRAQQEALTPLNLQLALQGFGIATSERDKMLQNEINNQLATIKTAQSNLQNLGSIFDKFRNNRSSDAIAGKANVIGQSGDARAKINQDLVSNTFNNTRLLDILNAPEIGKLGTNLANLFTGSGVNRAGIRIQKGVVSANKLKSIGSGADSLLSDALGGSGLLN